MLENSGMTKGFWAEALGTAAHIANWCPCKGLGWQTPFEPLFRRTPDVSYFQIFGCRAWKFNEEAKKWDPKVLPMVLISYKPGSKVYRLWDPKSRKIVVSANVWFTETELLYQPPKPAPPAPTPKPPVVTNWHFSCSFRLNFLNTYEHYPSDSILPTSPHSFQTISPAHSVHR